MLQTDKPGRAWAEDLVAAWIERRDTAPILRQIPAARREIATKIARANCKTIQFDAARVRDGMALDDVHRSRRAAVARYLAVRSK